MRLRNSLLAGLLAFGTMLSPIQAVFTMQAEAAEIKGPLKLTDAGGQSVKLEWEKPKKDSDQEMSYYIMRCESENGKYTEVNKMDYDSTYFVDYVPKAGTYYYKIIVSTDGEKPKADKIKATAITVKPAENLFTEEEACRNYIAQKLEEQAETFDLYYTKKESGEWFEPNDNYTIEVKREWHSKQESGHIYHYTYTAGYEMTKAELEAVEKAVADLMENDFKDILNTTSAEKTEAVYGYLADHTVRGEGSTIYSVFVEHAGTPEAVAKAAKKLLDTLNVESRIVNSEQGYWNLVQMADSCWYDVDIAREIEQMEKLEYNRFDYLLTAPDKEHATDQYKDLPRPEEDWTFNKTEPKNITSYTSEEGLIITWDHVNHADGYKVQRSSERDGTYTDVISYEGQKQEDRGWTTTNEILDSTAEKGQTYYYRVKAYSDYKGEKAEGIYGDSYGVTYYGTITLAINTSSFSPYLVWNKVEGATGYNIYRKETGHEEELLTTVTNEAYTDKSADANTNYAYRVQVVRGTTSGSRNEYYSNTVTTYGIKEIESSITEDDSQGMLIKIKSRSPNDQFRVYRYDTKKKAFALIAVTAKGQIEITDSEGIELNKSYTYCVAPFTETEKGRDINYKALPKEGYVLQAPDLAAESLQGIPVISWTFVENATGYELYEVNAEGEEKLINKYGCSTNKAYLLDKKGEKITVKIRAVVGKDYTSPDSGVISL